jgi:hypothetical protein
MGDDPVLVRPGIPDINGQFTAGKNIRRTRRLYDRIKNRKSEGDYNFGELTAFLNNFTEDQDDKWQGDIKRDYPDDKVIEIIKQNVVAVLSKVHPDDPHTPISLTIEWYPTDPKGVTMTSDSAGEAYTMKISGFRAPAKTSAESRKPKSY